MDFLLEALGSLALFLLSLVGLALRQFVTTRIHNLKLRTSLTRLADATITAVRSVAQSYADDLKEASKDGRLTNDERRYARDMALRKLKQLLGDAGVKEVQEVFGLYSEDLDKALVSRIESTVKELK